MNSVESLTKSLKQAGLRITPQRIAICRLLAETDTHPTASMLFDQIHDQFPTLSLATVYNTLDALVGLGMVNVLGPAGDGRVHFDADTEPHINLACTVCHKIVDVPSAQVGSLQAEVSRVSGYQLRGARIMYYGLCPDCQSKRN
jgi:Fur family transcriptional regulator, peroxide stress response regulator